jgi:hypothetical protein
LDEMLFLLNNLQAHLSQNFKEEAEKKTKGIDEIYMHIVQVYSQFEQDIGSRLLKIPFWSSIVWGLATRSMYIMQHSKLYEFKLQMEAGKCEEDVDTINQMFNQYYMPYQGFIRYYMQIALGLKVEDKEDEKNMGMMRQDLLVIMKQIAVRCSNADVMSTLNNFPVEQLVFSMLKKRDPCYFD